MGVAATLRGITSNEEIGGSRGYDAASLTLVGVCFVLLFNLRDRLPVFSDSWYHLSVIRAFAEKGFSRHAWWEFAPPGRPHLYSPLFHLVHAGLLRLTGAELLNVAKFWHVVTFPLALLAGWATARCWFGNRAAWLTVLLLAVNIGLLFPCSLIIMPGTLAVLLWPMAQLRVLRRDWIGGAILLAAMAYLHFGVAMVAAASVVALAVFDRKRARTSACALGAAVVLFSPWLVQLWRHREFVHCGVANLPVFLPVATVAGLICGVLAFVRKQDDAARALLVMILASGLFLLTVRERFWTYGGFLFALLGGYGLDRRAGRHLRWIVPVLGASVLSATPFLKPPGLKLALPVPFQSSPLLMGTPVSTLVVWQWTPQEVVAPDLVALSGWIARNVPGDQIVITDDRLLGEAIFALTGRRTTSGLWTEVMTDALAEELAAYRRSGSGYIVVASAQSPPRAVPVAEFGRYRVFYRAAYER